MIAAPTIYTPETLLDWWIRSNQLKPLFAGELGCTQLVANGMFWAGVGMWDMARVKDAETHARLIDCVAAKQWRALHFSEMVAVFNPELPACGCSLPRHLTQFAPGDELGFCAAVMEVGSDPVSGEQVAVLHIILQPPLLAHDSEDYLVLRLGTNGSLSLISASWPAELGWLPLYGQPGLAGATPPIQVQSLDLTDEALQIPYVAELSLNGPRLLHDYLHAAVSRLDPNHQCTN